MSPRPSRPVTTVAVAAFALAGIAALATAGCHRPAPDPAGTSSEASADVPSDAEVTLLAARCRHTDRGLVLGEGQGLEDLEIGDAVSYPGGYAVALVHRTTLGRVAAVALVRRDPLVLARIVDLGPTLGDAPPPRIGWRPPGLVAAAYLRSPAVPSASASAPSSSPPSPRVPAPIAPPRASGTPRLDDTAREVALFTLGVDPASAAPAAPLIVPQQRDDSLAFDLAFTGPSGLLVWDEATSEPRGVVKAAAFARDHAAAPHDLSPTDSDAELPRVIRAGAGFFVVWIARRAEPLLSDASESEATGEPRAYGWLETVTVDDHGVPVRPVRRLTPAGGHVSAFDVEVRAGDAAPTLLVVARDDGEAVDGSGGALLRVRVTGDVVEPPVAFATDGLGRGAPSFVSAAAPGSLALAWVSRDEEARLLPLDGSGSPTALPSAEEGLKDARALLFLDDVDGPNGAARSADRSEVLVAAPSDEAAQLRVFACAK